MGWRISCIRVNGAKPGRGTTVQRGRLRRLPPSPARPRSQVWHTPAGASANDQSTQLHVGACLPHKQSVAGVIPLHLLVSKLNFAR